MRRCIRLFGLALVLISLVGCQFSDIWSGGLSPLAPAQSANTGTFSGNRPAQEALHWGESVFAYPQWLVSIDEQDLQVFAIWKRAGAVVRYRQDRQYTTLAIDDVARLIDDAWLKRTMIDYATWKELNRCVTNDHLVIEMDAAAKNAPDAPLRVRYWVWASPDGFFEVFMAFPTQEADQLGAAADALFGTAARCRSGSAQ